MLCLLLCLGLLVGHNMHLAAAVGIGVICIKIVASVTHQGDARVRRAGCTRRGSWNRAGTTAGFEVGLACNDADTREAKAEEWAVGTTDESDAGSWRLGHAVHGSKDEL